jgi:serine/threonine-protein kinase
MTIPPAYPGYWGNPPFSPPPPPRRRGSTVLLIAVPIVLALGLIAAVAFAGVQVMRNIGRPSGTAPVAAADWQPYVDAGETVAKNLTTIDYRTVDRDVQRVLDSSTGPFHSDFAARSRDFVQTVRDSQSASRGTVNGAGIESMDADGARVLVAVRVETTNGGSANPEPKSWRLRITVVESEFGFKASVVEFVS